MADVWEREWEVYSAQLGGKGYLGPGVFKLTAVYDAVYPNQVDFYRVTILSGMHACWNPIRFFPRGWQKASRIGPVLPKWSNPVDSQWLAAADTYRKALGSVDFFPGIDPQVLRLEADIFPYAGNAEALTLACVDSGCESGDMLVVVLKSDIHTDEDGTAHGGAPH
jgi:hypothetical protein